MQQTNILVINSGSSSLKYSLLSIQPQLCLMSGLVECIGEQLAHHKYTVDNQASQQETLTIKDHADALQQVFATLQTCSAYQSQPLLCIAHRVVHGGERFSAPQLIDDAVIEAIRELIPLAPLHNPANLLGIEQARRQMPDLAQIAVFDTAFHQSLPDYAYRYALPGFLYQDHGVRRYGFHGSSHRYVAGRAAQYLDKPLSALNLISLHLGNGASVTAIAAGHSVDTSMGMTPLEGLMMGTRSGDLDPGIIFYLSRSLNMSLAAIETLLNKQSGCKGLCHENDMRTIHQHAGDGDLEAQLALAIYAYRVKKYIGAYLAVLGRVDALIFTGGIGENDAWLRAHCLENLHGLGIDLDVAKNQTPDAEVGNIASADSRTAILVIKTDEEWQIALESYQYLKKPGH